MIGTSAKLTAVSPTWVCIVISSVMKTADVFHKVLIMVTMNVLSSGWMLSALKNTRETKSRERVWRRTREEKNVPGCGSKTESCRRCVMGAGVSACTNHGPRYWSEASRGKQNLKWAAGDKQNHSINLKKFKYLINLFSVRPVKAAVTMYLTYLLSVWLCRVEGRTWYTSHRGRLWIAAAAKKPTPQETAEVEAMYRHIYKKGKHTVYSKSE